jgi:hypothetical protein
MGGNSRIINRDTGETIGRAEKVNLFTFDRTKLASDIASLFQVINTKFLEANTFLLWEREPDENFFSGSSKHFFNSQISDEAFLNFKPVIGDIDVMIPVQHYYLFSVLMQNLEGKQITPQFSYLGQDRNNFGTTFLAVFRYTDNKNSVDLQIDFEAVNWEHESQEPTEWAKFSHNSSWDDIVKGFKGVHHKFLLINLTRATSKREDAIVATPSSTPEKLRIVTGKKATQTPRELAFSVDRGLRVKYQPLNYNDGMPVTIEGKIVLQEIPTESSNYIQDVRQIFSRIFKKDPTTEEFEMFHSFKGIIELMHLYCDATEVHDCFEFALQENLFGKHAQIIEKNDPLLDYEVKMKFAVELYKEFRGWVGEAVRVEELAQEYIRNFKYEK